MKKILNRKKAISAEEIAKKADRGEDISRHFTNKFTVVRPQVQRVNVDFTLDTLRDLDATTRELNVSRQAVIKMFVRQALDQHLTARHVRKAA